MVEEMLWLRRDCPISIIVPVHNAEPHLDRCVKSILSQTLKNIEIILVESGSTDNSEALCAEYEKQYDSIRFIHLGEPGVSKARNAGLDIARGDYIGFMDADDEIDPAMYESLYDIVVNRRVEVAACNYYRVNRPNKPVPQEIYPEFEQYLNRVLDLKEGFSFFCELSFYSFCIWDRLYKKEIIADNHIRFPTDTSAGEDLVFNYYVYINTKRSWHTDAAYYYYFRHPTSLGAANALSYTLMREWFKGSWRALLELVQNTDSAICGESVKSKLRKTVITKFVVPRYLRYQWECYLGYVLSERLDYDKTYFIFGASEGGVPYVNSERKFSRLFFVDNDVKKHGTTIRGYKVISPDQMKTLCTGDYKIIIASIFMLDIFTQLRNMGLVDKLDDVFISDGKTQWDKVYIDSLELFLNA